MLYLLQSLDSVCVGFNKSINRLSLKQIISTKHPRPLLKNFLPCYNNIEVIK